MSIDSFLNDVKNEREVFFGDYLTKKDNMITESTGGVELTPIYDIKGLYQENTNEFPSLESIINNSGLDVMTFGITKYTSGFPITYKLKWQEGYPVKRFYICNNGQDDCINTISKDTTILPNNWNWNIISYPLGTPETYVSMSEEFGNVYAVIDIWGGEVPPTTEQIDSYYAQISNLYPRSNTLNP